MPCFHPQHGYRGPNGGFVCSSNQSPTGIAMTVPCGRCEGCLNARRKQWGVRIDHEKQMHEANAFVTLTYSDEHLPDDYSVRLRVVQLFIKRLRKALPGVLIRFFACGEYGEDGGRPHYHIIIFGYDFPDKTPWRKTASGFTCYRSELLEKVWSDPVTGECLGNCEIGSVTAASGSYVAGYVLKKFYGADAQEHYQRLHPVTGEVVFVEPEFCSMSTKPGIGASWFEKWERDAFPSDFLVVDGKKVSVPRYYANKLKDRFRNAGSRPDALVPVDDFTPIKRKRRAASRTPEALFNSTPERLATLEESANRRRKFYKREGL